MNTYQNMVRVIDHLVASPLEHQSLEVLAKRFQINPTRFQKDFTLYTGVSPKQFQRFLSLKTAREFLLQGYSTLEAAYEAGLSGNGRLHQACITIDAASPGDVKSRGRGVDIFYGWGETALGSVLLGVTLRGICWLAFELNGDRNTAEDIFRKRFKNAKFIKYNKVILPYIEQINHLVHVQRDDNNMSSKSLPAKIRLNLFGTNFQMKVWEALLKIPAGATLSYGQIADHVCTKKASRAVGSAVGANPVSYLIPCHRVIQQSGVVENYAWGSARKKVLLGMEGNTGH